MGFSERILEYVYGNDSRLDEVMKELLNIGFDRVTSANIVESEIELIKRRKIKKIKKDYYSDNVAQLTMPIEKYDLFYNGYISENALLFTEIIRLYSSAKKIVEENNLNYSYEVIEEINYIYKKGIQSPLLELIYNRFNYMYHIANKDFPREKWIDNSLVDEFIKIELLRQEKGNI